MVEAFILIRIGTRETLSLAKTIREEICRIKGVQDVFGVFGRYDFVIKVETKSLEELGNLVMDRIRGIEGVLNTETLVIGF